MTPKTFKNFIKDLETKSMSYMKYVNLKQIMTPYQRVFVDIYFELKD